MRKYIILNLFLTALLSSLLYCQSNITYEAGTNIEIQKGADVCADAVIINGTFSGSGTICQGVLPVMLSSFTFSVNKNNAVLSWTTEFEINNNGFDLERRLNKEGSQWQKITFVQGSGTSNEPRSYSYEDKKLQPGKYQYQLKQLDFNGNYEYFSLGNDVFILQPGKFSVSQNYPNPSNPISKIDYELPVDTKVSISLYNQIGQEVKVLVNEVKEAGYYTAEFDGTNLASGIYFYIMKTESFINTKKLVLIK